MSNCLTCGAELIHVEGRRKKKYCNQTCKQQYWNKNKKEPMKCIPVAEFEKWMDEFNGLKKEVQQFRFSNKKGEVISSPSSSETVTVTLSKNNNHPLYQDGDPNEGSMAFMRKYDCMNYKELEAKTK